MYTSIFEYKKKKEMLKGFRGNLYKSIGIEVVLLRSSVKFALLDLLREKRTT